VVATDDEASGDSEGVAATDEYVSGDSEGVAATDDDVSGDSEGDYVGGDNETDYGGSDSETVCTAALPTRLYKVSQSCWWACRPMSGHSCY
jgi:hypothetical protein